jgi:hypothetical protein
VWEAARAGRVDLDAAIVSHAAILTESAHANFSAGAAK